MKKKALIGIACLVATLATYDGWRTNARQDSLSRDLSFGLVLGAIASSALAIHFTSRRRRLVGWGVFTACIAGSIVLNGNAWVSQEGWAWQRSLLYDWNLYTSLLVLSGSIWLISLSRQTELSAGRTSALFLAVAFLTYACFSRLGEPSRWTYGYLMEVSREVLRRYRVPDAIDMSMSELDYRTCVAVKITRNWESPRAYQRSWSLTGSEHDHAMQPLLLACASDPEVRNYLDDIDNRCSEGGGSSDACWCVTASAKKKWPNEQTYKTEATDARTAAERQFVEKCMSDDLKKRRADIEQLERRYGKSDSK